MRERASPRTSHAALHAGQRAGRHDNGTTVLSAKAETARVPTPCFGGRREKSCRRSSKCRIIAGTPASVTRAPCSRGELRATCRSLSYMSTRAGPSHPRLASLLQGVLGAASARLDSFAGWQAIVTDQLLVHRSCGEMGRRNPLLHTFGRLVWGCDCCALKASPARCGSAEGSASTTHCCCSNMSVRHVCVRCR